MLNFLWDWCKNTFLYPREYNTHHEAVVISCYFNPQQSPYRRLAFDRFYNSINHLNFRIIECYMKGSQPELRGYDNVDFIETDSLLWHKEALLSILISKLPKKFKYVMWVDADVIFTNKNWLRDAVFELSVRKTYDGEDIGSRIVQLFDTCVHLQKDQLKPAYDVDVYRKYATNFKWRKPDMWRSFGYNYVEDKKSHNATNYDIHGHVGFAWGARREILDVCGLYDKAPIGGADHIMAHAAAAQVNHSCIEKAYGNDQEIYDWSRAFNDVIGGKLGYIKGDLYHIWHGDVAKRQYLKRIKEFTPLSSGKIVKGKNGLYSTQDDSTIQYMNNYFMQREVTLSELENKSMEAMYSAMFGNDNTHPVNLADVAPVEFGGGQSGGAGSSGTWEEMDNESHPINYDDELETHPEPESTDAGRDEPNNNPDQHVSSIKADAIGMASLQAFQVLEELDKASDLSKETLGTERTLPESFSPADVFAQHVIGDPDVFKDISDQNISDMSENFS